MDEQSLKKLQIARQAAKIAGQIKQKSFARTNRLNKVKMLLSQANMSFDEAREQLEANNLADEAAAMADAMNETTPQASAVDPTIEASRQPEAAPEASADINSALPGGAALESPAPTVPPPESENPEDTEGGDATPRPAGSAIDNSATEEPVAETASDGTPPAPAEQPQTAQQRAAEAVKKEVTDKAKKKVLQAIWKLILPYLPWIIAGVAIIIICIALFAYFNGLKNKQGKSDSQPASPTSDSDAILALGQKAGIADMTKALTGDLSNQMKQNLSDLANNPSITDAAFKTQINTLITQIGNAQANANSTATPDIVNNLKSILQKAADFQAPVMTTQGVAPSASIFSYNDKLHNGTVQKKEMPADGSGHATYMHYGDGTGDAVDLYVNPGSDVLTSFTGKIVDISDDGTGNKKIIISSGDYEMLYAFVKPVTGLTVGKNVNKGDKIATASTVDEYDVIHVELSYCGRSVVTTPMDISFANSETKPVGGYLWDHMKKILNIP